MNFEMRGTYTQNIHTHLLVHMRQKTKIAKKFGSINFKCKQALMHGITRILWLTSMLSLLEYLPHI